MMLIGLDKSGQKSDIYHTARQERRKPKGEIQMKNKKYYIAYGSNLSVEQMADRCPDAKIAGQAVLAGWDAFVPRLRHYRTEPEEEHAGSGVGNLGNGRRKPRPL